MLKSCALKLLVKSTKLKIKSNSGHCSTPITDVSYIFNKQ